MKITKLLFVEDGSIDIDDLEDSIKQNNLGIKIVVYRAGSCPPKLVDIKDGGKTNE